VHDGVEVIWYFVVGHLLSTNTVVKFCWWRIASGVTSESTTRVVKLEYNEDLILFLNGNKYRKIAYILSLLSLNIGDSG
jgi:hypothetical protein